MKQDYWTYNKPLSMAGLGGGATSLQNAGGLLFSYDDAAYDNFFSKGKAPINISNTSSDFTYGTSSDVVSGINPFYDTSERKIWSEYNSAGYNGWSNSSFNYGGGGLGAPANYYKFSSSFTALAGQSSASSDGLGAGARGLTIAFLQDDTPVIVISEGFTFYFFNYPAGTYIGYIGITYYQTNTPGGYNENNIAFDGTYLIYHDNFKFYYYDMPANTSSINGGTINRTLMYSAYNVSSNTTTQHGLVSGGGNILYVGTTQGATKFTLSAANGLYGTATESTLYTHQGSGSNMTLSMDYKNRKLVMRNSGRDFTVFGE
jgi:hypothetical protein|tara:strand:- start:5506 stop:6456 length:951 start_codon:yes stop_codon:yes gene_type:complete